MGRSFLSLTWLAWCVVASAQNPAGDAAFRQGAELYRAGDCLGAVAQLSQSKGTPRAQLLMGRCYLETGDYANARTSLQQYAQAAPDDEQAAILLARAMEGAGDSAQAAKTLEELRKKQPASLALQDALAEAYAKAGKPADATTIYNSILAAQPTDIGALLGLAGLAASAAQWQAAADGYKKVLDLAPEDATAVAGMGLAQAQLGKTTVAIPYLEHATKLRPDDWGLSKALANCYVQGGRWAEVIDALEFNSLAHADDEEATGWMVQSFGHMGDTAAAEQYYRTLLQKAAGNYPARLTLANLLYDSRRLPDAKEQYLLVLKAKPDYTEINDRVGQISEQEGNLPDAIRFYEAACHSPQATHPMMLRLAHLYYRTGDMAKARPALESVLQSQPDNAEVKTMLVQLAVKENRTADAVRLATELLPSDPNNVMLLRLLGEDALKRSDDIAAADFLERAFTVNEKDRELRFEIVGLYTNVEALNRLSRAFDLMNEYVGLNPDDYEGYLLLANLYRRKQDAANAHQFFNRGLEIMPANPPARMSWAYNSVGLLYFSEGKFEDALSNQLKAVALNPADANSQYNLALCYLKLKRKEDVNAAREKLSQMSAPELLTALDDQIERSKINRGK